MEQTIDQSWTRLQSPGSVFGVVRVHGSLDPKDVQHPEWLYLGRTSPPSTSTMQ